MSSNNSTQLIVSLISLNYKMSQQLSSSSSSKKRVYITAEQKRELCLLKQTKPQPKNIELAQKYNISTSQVSDISKESNRWLEIDPNSYQVKLKKAHKKIFLLLCLLIL